MKATLRLALCLSLFLALPSLSHAQFGKVIPKDKKPAASKSTSKSGSFGSLLKNAAGLSKARSPADKELRRYVQETTKRITYSQKKKLHTILAKGSQAELEKIDGIGEVKAKTIIAARPLLSVEDLANVSGFGKKTYGGVITWAKKTL